MAMIRVCPEASRLVDVAAGASGQTSIETIHSSLASSLCLQGGQCFLNWENCWQDTWSPRALAAAGVQLITQASSKQARPVLGQEATRITYVLGPVGSISAWETSAFFWPPQALSTEKSSGRRGSHSAKLLANPSCPASTVKGMKGSAELPGGPSSSPASSEMGLSRCHTWALNQFLLIISITSTEKRTRDISTEVSFGHAFTFPEDINIFTSEHISFLNNFNGSYGLKKCLWILVKTLKFWR